MKCIKCGAELAEDSKFCNVCGEPVPQGGGAPTLVVENVTEAPIVAPVVLEPLTEAQAAAPVVLEPVTEAEAVAPVVLEPVTEAEAVAPVVLEPVTEAEAVAPVVQEPVTEAQVVDQVVPEPVTEAQAVSPVAAPQTPTAVPVTQPAPTVAPKKNNIGLILVILLLVAIAAGGGIFIGKSLFGGHNDPVPAPSPDPISTKVKVSFGEMEYEIPEDYEYSYDTLQKTTPCLVVDMSNELEMIIYESGYSYFTFENSFDKLVAKNYPDAINTYTKYNKYAFVNYKILDSQGILYFYDGAVNINTTQGLGVIIAKVDKNVDEDDFNKAMDIVNTAKKSRGIDRNQGEGKDNLGNRGQGLITNYLNETPAEENPVDESE